MGTTFRAFEGKSSSISGSLLRNAPAQAKIYFLSIPQKVFADSECCSAEDSRRRTPISYAVDEDIVDLLLDAHARFSVTDFSGSEVLSLVLGTDAWDSRSPPSKGAIRLLLQRGHANPDQSTDNGERPLTFAMKHGVEIVELLLRHGADPNFESPFPTSSHRTAWGSPLPRVLTGPDPVKMARLLLRYGASVDVTGFKCSPLLEAVGKDAVDLVKLFLANGADVNRCAEIGMYWDPTQRIYSPITLALAKQNLELADLLLGAGAVITHPERNALDLAAVRLRPKSFAFLLRHGLQLSKKTVYAAVLREYIEKRKSPVYYLGHGPTRENHLQLFCEMLDMIVVHGAEVSHPYMSVDDNPVFMAVESGDIGLLSKVLSHGANVNVRKQTDKYRIYTPLHHAALKLYDKKDMFHCLISHGADIAAGSRPSGTPLAAMILDGWHRLADWDTACQMLEIDPTLTYRFSCALMAIFLSRVAVHGSCARHPEQDMRERILLFARLTNVNDRWGPDGISGLCRLTSRPEFRRCSDGEFSGFNPYQEVSDLEAGQGKLNIADDIIWNDLCTAEENFPYDTVKRQRRVKKGPGPGVQGKSVFQRLGCAPLLREAILLTALRFASLFHWLLGEH